MTQTLKRWTRLSGLPLGKKVFSVAVGLRAPYFSTIRATIQVVEPNHAALLIRRRRRVTNHIGSVHAIALCNGLEGVAALVAEASIPPNTRWIPTGMEVQYLAKADGDIVCVGKTSPESWTSGSQQVSVEVHGERSDGTTVIRGRIHLKVTSTPSGRLKSVDASAKV